jgi:predicted dinucleotide-binding enzyme
MKIAIVGTGMVGQTIASKLEELGHEVYMGTRNANETKSRTDVNQMTGKSFSDWHSENKGISVVNFSDLPSDCDVYFNATHGANSIDALNMVGDKLNGRILVDVANPLDFSNGMPPSLFVCNTDSLGEQIQRTFPEAHVVKSFNTMNCYLMVNPSLVQGDHNVFVSGNDESAKNTFTSLLKDIGWGENQILDLGDITSARATEMMLPIWLQLWGKHGHANFNFNINAAN